VTTVKQLRQLLAIALAVALFASACGGGGDEPDSSTSSGGDTPTEDGSDDVTEVGADDTATGEDLVTEESDEITRGGTLRIGVEADPASLNPTNTALAVGAVLMATSIFDTLVVYDENDQWVNNLTESFVANDDFTEWEMTVRPGITFTDGETLNADAVLRNIEAQVGDPLIGLLFDPIFADEGAFEKVDDMTILIRPKGPNSAIPAYFTTQLGMMASPKWLDAAAENPDLNQEPVGSGPFMIESRVQDSVTRVVRNDNWWRTDQEVYLDAVEFYPNNQETVRADQLLAGDLEMNHATDAGSIERMRADDSLNRIEDDSGEEFFFIFNTQRGPMSDIRVRQAATHAFPRAQYTDFIMRDTTNPAETLFASSSEYHQPDIVQPHDQPELAAALIEAHCTEFPENCTDGKANIEYQYNVPSLTLDEIATLVGDAWSPYFNITIDQVPQDEFILEVALGTFDVSTWRYHGQLDPEVESAFLVCDSVGAISINWSRYCDPARDELLLQQRQTTDQAERVAIWAEVQQNIADAQQYLIISHTTWIVGSSPEVMNVCGGTTVDGVRKKCMYNGHWSLPQIWISQ